MVPSHLDIKVGYLCNNNCIHCAIGDTRRELKAKGIPTELSTEEVLELITKSDADTCTLTGGEITLRDDCETLIAQASKKFKYVNVQTNGRLLCRVTNVPTNVTFTVAIHGTENTHNAITGNARSYRETIESLKDFKGNVVVKTVITKANYKELYDVVDLCHMLHIRHINFAYAHGVGDCLTNLEQKLVRYTDIDINGVCSRALSLGISPTVETFPLCLLNDKELSDDLRMPQSHCKPVNDECFNWSEERVREKYKAESCSDCCLSNLCEGCWNEYAELYGISEFKPIKGPKLTAYKLNQKLRILNAVNTSSND